jgi:hypothetical protein
VQRRLSQLDCDQHPVPRRLPDIANRNGGYDAWKDAGQPSILPEQAAV